MVNCDKPVIFKGVLCSYCALDFKDIKLGCKRSEECLCCVDETCIHADLDDNLGIGLVTDPSNKEFCKLGLFCCSLGLKMPTTLCNGACHFLVIKTANSLPFDEDFMPELNCTIFFIQCVSGYKLKFGFMPNIESKIFEKWENAPAAEAEAPEVEEPMERE